MNVRTCRIVRRSAPAHIPSLAILMAGVVCLFGAGCGAGGPERAAVSGVVTLDGAPLETGTIAFIPDGQTVGPTAGAMIQMGRYQTQPGFGPVLGSHRVEITAFRQGKTVEIPGIGGTTTGASAGATVQETEMYIPDRYNKNSTLTVTIKSGSNPLDFPLKTLP